MKIPLYITARRGILRPVGIGFIADANWSAELSGDEGMVLVFSAAIGLAGTFNYCAYLMRVSGLGTSRWKRWPLLVFPVIGFLLLSLILRYFSASDVKNNFTCQMLFLLLGLAWMTAAINLFPLLGLSIRQDALAGRNPAAIIALSGAMLAILLAYAGGNIGEGPTIWTTIFSSALATGGWFALWFVLEQSSSVSLAISEERDLAAAWRLAGLLVANALLLGRAVAGDWHSMEGTWLDFLTYGWPAIALTITAAKIEGRLQPTLVRPHPAVGKYGIMPAVFYLTMAITILLVLGKWK